MVEQRVRHQTARWTTIVCSERPRRSIVGLLREMRGRLMIAVVDTMNVLMQRAKEPGPWLEGVPMPSIGINYVLVEVLRTDGHLTLR
jgi:hypothetical protein